MAADETTVKQRITEALNVVSPGTFSTMVDSNYKDRVAAAITEYSREGAMMIARAIVSNARHTHRNLFISGTPTALTHQGELPDMAGEMDLIEIELYSGGAYTTGTPASVQQIESYRLNPSNLYGSLAHTTQNSPLSGYYNIKNGRIYFTGNAARGYFPSIVRTTVTTLIPDEYEGSWFLLGMGFALKEGDNLLPIAQYYMELGMRDLQAIASMSIIQPVPPMPRAIAARGDAQ